MPLASVLGRACCFWLRCGFKLNESTDPDGRGSLCFVLCDVFADGQLLAALAALGTLPPISLRPVLIHLSYLLAQPTGRAVFCRMDRNIYP